MKFGKNLAHLLIPEWKVYNLDYNDLKASIRDATRLSSPDLAGLYQKFSDNFDYLNLFVSTKSGELSRKVRVYQDEFRVLQTSSELPAQLLAKLSRLHYQIINDVSTELRKLTKFILVQKIAVKKIFKKFTKHYPDKAVARAFVSSLTHVLQTNPSSFVNWDLSRLTSQLLALLEEIDAELRHVHAELHRKPVFHPLPGGQLLKSHSVSTFKTRSTISHESDENVHVDAVNNQAARFDLITQLKKNFVVLALVPKDKIARTDVSLSMDVYLNIPKLDGSSRMCVTFLTENSADCGASYVISYQHLPVSVVVAHTGGLRKYLYCCLANPIVEAIFRVCLAESPAARAEMEAQLRKLVDMKPFPAMTKLTVESLLASGQKPSLRFVCDRTRYFVAKDSSDDMATVSVESSHDNVPVSSSDKIYEDSYYMTLDENVCTSNSIPESISFGTDGMDAFPYSVFCIHSNDSNLYNFEASLTTEVDESRVQTKYKEILFRKMPAKITGFLRNTSVQMVKNLSLYEYMRSCYFNEIPADANNHYLRLLSINLLKNLEIVDVVNTQNSVDECIIQDKARSILNRQMLCKSFQDISLGNTPPLDPLAGQASIFEQNTVSSDHQKDTYSAYNNSQLKYFQKFNDLENLDFDDDDEDSYFVYLTFNNDLEDNVLNSVLLLFIKFKHRIRKTLSAFNIHSHLWKSYKEKHERDFLNYDSINEDHTFLNNANDYQIQLIYDYDHVLSVMYFILCFSALFIAGINMGIVYGLLKLHDNLDVHIVRSPWMVFLLVFGFLFSLVFSMTSINLSFQRFQPLPAAHYGIIWAGFLMVTATVVWTVVAILL